MLSWQFVVSRYQVGSWGKNNEHTSGKGEDTWKTMKDGENEFKTVDYEPNWGSRDWNEILHLKNGRHKGIWT